MADFRIILTADYEVWGDGSGCVENCVIEPAECMLEIAGKFKAPITFFLDVCEYWAFEQTEKAGSFSNDYHPAMLMREQLRKAMEAGCDVQLHFHPQWLNYRFIANQRWELDYRYWRLPEVGNFSGEWTIEKLFKKGIETLNELFLPVNPDYRVHSFRAGAWCIQPEAGILEAMRNCGLRYDSTVATGMKRIDGLNSFDYTHAPRDLYAWNIGQKVDEPGGEGLREIPIATAQIPLARKLYYKFLKLGSKARKPPRKCEKMGYGSNYVAPPSSAIERLFREKYAMLNFSDGVSCREMIYILDQTIKKQRSQEKFSEVPKSDISRPFPIVAISHPKTFNNAKNFELFLKYAASRGNISFGTFASL